MVGFMECIGSDRDKSSLFLELFQMLPFWILIFS